MAGSAAVADPGSVRGDDLPHLARCLELARRGRFGVAPNPMVGAVLVAPDGTVLGEGWHARVGGPHAEVAALDAARAAGHGDTLRGATAYVSLEPCSHQGRTPPCSRALIEAGVARVVACHRDPNPRVDGGGFRALHAAGVEVASGAYVDEAVRLNWRFLVQQVLGRPGVTLKWAMSLDGRIATRSGDSQWISSPEGLEWSQEQRETHDAILVGSGTALADDPRLDRRLGKALGPNLRVVLDRRLRLSPDAKMLKIGGPVVVYARRARGEEAAERADSLRRSGAEVVFFDDPNPSEVVADLGRRGVQSLLVEGGAEILGAFAAAGLFDRVAVCCAPILIGGAGAPGPMAGAGFDPLSNAPRLAPFDLSHRGPDVVLTTFRARCLQDLSASVAG